MTKEGFTEKVHLSKDLKKRGDNLYGYLGKRFPARGNSPGKALRQGVPGVFGESQDQRRIC